MYEAYEYTQKHGIMLKGQYAHSYTPHAQHCKQTDQFHFKNTDMMEHDQMTNDEIKEQLLVQPVGVAIYSTGMLQSYTKGIVTEEYLHCSKESNEVNHGVVLVGFGSHKDEKVRGHCKDYWIVRNSWGSRWGENGFFKLCADNPFTEKLPFGTCLVNQFGTWPI